MCTTIIRIPTCIKRRAMNGVLTMASEMVEGFCVGMCQIGEPKQLVCSFRVPFMPT